MTFRPFLSPPFWEPFGGLALQFPTEIPGLMFYSDASYITGLNDGDSVTTWNDLSGNGNHATQATASQKPIYKVNIINGKPVVRLDSVDDNLIVTNGAALFRNKPGATVFAVVLFNALTATRRYFQAETNAPGSVLVGGAALPQYRILDADAV